MLYSFNLHAIRYVLNINAFMAELAISGTVCPKQGLFIYL